MRGFVENEALRTSEQHRLDRLKSADERNKLGQFATPNALAVAIAAHLVGLRSTDSGPIRFLDPALGSGSFYSALRRAVSPDQIREAVGIEIDPDFAGLATNLWSRSGLTVTPGDFTRLDPPPIGQRANLILANPPYVRHHHLGLVEKRRLKELVRQRSGFEVSGLAGFYLHFLLLSDAWLETGGLAAWLIPSEFMDVNYGTILKKYLTDRVRLHQIHRFRPDDAQFGDALVTSAVVIFEKSSPDPTRPIVLSYGGSLGSPEHAERLSLDDLRAARKWTNFPRRPSLDDPGPASITTLGDLFTIRRGLVTGANGFFIKPRSEAIELGWPERYLRPILPSPRYLNNPVIESDLDGNPSLENPLVLLDCDRPEAEVQRDHPALWAYLQDGAACGLDAGYLTSRRDPWYSQERRDVPPFVCTYMGRHRADRPPFRFFWNRSQAVAANVYLLLYLRGPLKRALEARPELLETVFHRLQEIRPVHFLDEGRVYGGGLHKMEPKELAALPADAIVEALGSAWTGPRQSLLAGLA